VIINHVGEEIAARDVLTQFLIFEHFTVEFLFFLIPPNYGIKLNIYEPNTPFLDEVWFRPLYIKISCLDQSYFSSCEVKLIVQVRKHAKKWRILKLLISFKFHFHHDKQVKISLLGEYQPRRWRNSGQGRLNSIFNFWAFYRRIFVFSYSAKLWNKTQHLWTENPIYRWSLVQASIY
jgi:hypothetical protein